MIFVLDNYDSFTYNLVHYLQEQGEEVDVRRNDALRPEEVLATGCRGIVISPGPGRPEEAGITLALVRLAAGSVPLLGVCLGHQAIGLAFGGRVGPAPALMHGKTSLVHHDGRGLFRGLPAPLPAMRYHSLAVEPEGLPACLEVSAWTGDGTIMGVRHREHRLEGVQFHPESVGTPHGRGMIASWLEALP